MAYQSAIAGGGTGRVTTGNETGWATGGVAIGSEDFSGFVTVTKGAICADFVTRDSSADSASGTSACRFACLYWLIPTKDPATARVTAIAARIIRLGVMYER